MPDPGESPRFFDNSSPSVAAGDSSGDPIGPLMNLSAVSYRMDSLHSFLSDSINGNVLLGNQQMEMVSSEISSAIQQAISSGAALLALCQIPNSASQNPNSRVATPAKISELKSVVDDDSKVEEPKSEPVEEELDEQGGKIDIEDDIEVIELDAVELLAEHVHFCEICGKGFKRDANLRMHMRAHGEQFKRPEALAKPPSVAVTTVDPAATGGGRKPARFSCPFAGCNRNRRHKKFRPLKSVICVRNHFKRSHCPKMYTCNRCNKKNFSVLSDLKSHLKHCGELKWRCSCGTTFSRKDKLFGHIALFEGHMPAIRIDDDENRSKNIEAAFMEEDGVPKRKSNEVGVGNGVDDGFFDGLPDEFGEIDEKFFRQMLGSSSSSSSDFNQHFYNF